MLYGDYGHLGLGKRDEMKRFDGLEYKISRPARRQLAGALLNLEPSSIKPAPKDGRLLVAERDGEEAKLSVR